MSGPGLPGLFLVPVSFGPGTFNGQDPPLKTTALLSQPVICLSFLLLSPNPVLFCVHIAKENEMRSGE
ncbi:hypothetical protein Hanom_Chr11g00987111 [Helianthus anomalus]